MATSFLEALTANSCPAAQYHNRRPKQGQQGEQTKKGMKKVGESCFQPKASRPNQITQCVTYRTDTTEVAADNRIQALRTPVNPQIIKSNRNAKNRVWGKSPQTPHLAST